MPHRPTAVNPPFFIFFIFYFATMGSSFLVLFRQQILQEKPRTDRGDATVRRIHDATISLVSLDRQMVGRLTRTVVPDFMYREYKALYLELKSSVAARGAPRPPGAVREEARPPNVARGDARAPARSRGRRGSGLKGKRTQRMSDQLAEFKAWLRANPVNECDAARTVGARAATYWRLHLKTFERDALRTGEKRGFSCTKTLASAYRNCKR